MWMKRSPTGTSRMPRRDPSDPASHPRSAPPPSPAGSTIAAPAPSAKSTAVVRSVRSRIEVSRSTPTTTIAPGAVGTRPPATRRPSTKPAQAACRSKDPHRNPRLSHTAAPVCGRAWSGVHVASTRRPTSSGVRPASFSASATASVASDAVVSDAPAQRRAPIPERDRIHSSDVSRTASSSVFVTSRSGRARPRPVIARGSTVNWRRAARRRAGPRAPARRRGRAGRRARR